MRIFLPVRGSPRRRGGYIVTDLLTLLGAVDEVEAQVVSPRRRTGQVDAQLKLDYYSQPECGTDYSEATK